MVKQGCPGCLDLKQGICLFPPMAGPYDLIIFDLDGTLLDSRQDIANCVNWTLKDLGLQEIPHEDIYGYVGHGVRQLIEGAVTEAHGEGVFEKALDLFDKHYMKHLLDHTQLMPGMRNLLNDVGANGRSPLRAILTNKPEKYTDIIVEGLEIKDNFFVIAGREFTIKRKPDPEPVLEILKMAKVSPERTIIIGDTEVDIQAGKAAGIKTCGVLFGFGKKEMIESAEPDFIVGTVAELKPILMYS
jgi:phosphoglycolate phosphatase